MPNERTDEDGSNRPPEPDSVDGARCAPRSETADITATLEDLRRERERLLRIIEEQLAVTSTLAARPAQNTSVWWFLLSLCLVLVLALVMGAWLYLSQFPPVDDGEGAGVCAERSIDHATQVRFRESRA